MTSVPIRTILILLLTLTGCTRRNSAQSVPTPEVREHLKAIVAELPKSSLERQLVEQGRFGDGVRKKWMDGMKKEGVKAVAVEVYMTWFFGPRQLKPVRVMYFTDYDGGRQVVDEKSLERFRKSGLEDALKREAKIHAPHGAWVDLPHSVFWPFAAATTVNLFDEEWLPIPPHLFTTFGPTRPPLIAAVGQGDEVDVNHLLASGQISKQDVSSALFYACNDSQTRLLRRLLDAGGDPNVYVNTRKEEVAYTPLMTAIWNHAPAAVETLLAAGAKVNGAQGYAGETPLTLAASSSSDLERITVMLLDAGADVNATNEYGLTALMDATHRQSAAVIEMLIKRGAVVDTRDHQGRTALQFAAERGNVEAVQVLLGSHSNVNAKDDRGNTPLSVAHNPQIAQLLREAGAR